jgi:regulator of replication initiation timing
VSKTVEVLEILLDYANSDNSDMKLLQEQKKAIVDAISAIKERDELKQKLASLRKDIENERPKKKGTIQHYDDGDNGYDTGFDVCHDKDTEALDRVFKEGE